MGDAVWYEAVNDGTTVVQSFKWEYQFTSGTCPGTWVLAPFVSPTAAFYECRPGTWQVRLTANYMGGYSAGPPPMMLPPPPPAVITKNVTIAPATGFQIVSGLSTPTPRANSIVMKFRLRAGMKDCGPYLMGILAQERITNCVGLSPPFPATIADDPDWWPDSPQSTFQIQGNEIHDTKSMDLSDADWNAIPSGTTIYSRDQNLRLKYVDPCGTTKYISLGTIRLHNEKVDANNWQIYVIP